MAHQRLQERVIVARQGGPLRARLSPGAWLGMLRRDMADLARFRHVLRNFVVSELKVRYQRSVLGFLWTLLNPLMMMAVLALVFSQIMGRTISDYALYLFSGLIPWQLFAASIADGSEVLIVNEMLIKRIEVPKFLFPLKCVLVAAVNMVFAVAALFLLLCFLGARVHLQIVLLPAAVAVLAVFTLGMAMISMTLVSRYRDFQHMIGVFLQAFYFLCPILYERKFLDKYPAVRDLNPFSYILLLFQEAFYYGRWPAWPTWAAAGGCAAGAFLLGYVIYKHCEPNYVFWL